MRCGSWGRGGTADQGWGEGKRAGALRFGDVVFRCIRYFLPQNILFEDATVISRHMTSAAKRLLELRDQPAYHLTDAASYVRLPVATLRSWVSERSYATSAGRRRAQPLIVPADPTQRILSFNNLVEAHVFELSDERTIFRCRRCARL